MGQQAWLGILRYIESSEFAVLFVISLKNAPFLTILALLRIRNRNEIPYRGRKSCVLLSQASRALNP